MSRVLCLLIVINMLDFFYLVISEDTGEYDDIEENNSKSSPEMNIMSWDQYSKRSTISPIESQDDSSVQVQSPENQNKDEPGESAETQESPIRDDPGDFNDNLSVNDDFGGDDRFNNNNEEEIDVDSKNLSVDIDGLDGHPRNQHEGEALNADAEDVSIDIDGLGGDNRNVFEGETLNEDGEDSLDIDGISDGERYKYYNNRNDHRTNLKAINNDNQNLGKIVVLDSMDVRNYRAEIAAGNKADTLGTNAHYYQPDTYPDFGRRRSIPQYPYEHNVAKEYKIVDHNTKLTPKLAPAELVLAIARESAALSALEPKNHKDKSIMKGIQRTGDYWNAVWKEDIDPQVLRTKISKKLESVRAEIRPGSTLYDPVTKLKQISPKLLYIINENQS